MGQLAPLDETGRQPEIAEQPAKIGENKGHCHEPELRRGDEMGEQRRDADAHDLLDHLVEGAPTQADRHPGAELRASRQDVALRPDRLPVSRPHHTILTAMPQWLGCRAAASRGWLGPFFRPVVLAFGIRATSMRLKRQYGRIGGPFRIVTFVAIGASPTVTMIN